MKKGNSILQYVIAIFCIVGALCIFDDPPEGEKTIEAFLVTKAVGATCLAVAWIIHRFDRHEQTDK